MYLRLATRLYISCTDDSHLTIILTILMTPTYLTIKCLTTILSTETTPFWVQCW